MHVIIFIFIIFIIYHFVFDVGNIKCN